MRWNGSSTPTARTWCGYPTTCSPSTTRWLRTVRGGDAHARPARIPCSSASRGRIASMPEMLDLLAELGLLSHLDRLGKADRSAFSRLHGSWSQDRAGAAGRRHEPRARHSERNVSDVGLRGRKTWRILRRRSATSAPHSPTSSSPRVSYPIKGTPYYKADVQTGWSSCSPGGDQLRSRAEDQGPALADGFTATPTGC